MLFVHGIKASTSTQRYVLRRRYCQGVNTPLPDRHRSSLFQATSIFKTMRATG